MMVALIEATTVSFNICLNVSLVVCPDIFYYSFINYLENIYKYTTFAP